MFTKAPGADLQGSVARSVAPPVEPRQLGALGRAAHPVDLLEGQAKSRVPELVPIGHRRMWRLAVAFTEERR